ncbi:MAG: PAS domain S-box protein, partial [Rhodospirillales bacterium]|nr:PAS domain S-box protein [Rhodospirillales bacterium]
MAGTCAGEGPIALESTEGLAGSGADLSDDARAILESMGEAFYALDSAWRVTYANRRALAFWRSSFEEVRGQVLWDSFPSLRGTRNEEAIRACRAEQRVLTFEAPSPINGVWVRATVTPFKDGVTVYWRDISERRRAEETLRASEAHLRLAQEAAGIGTWDWDLETGRIVWSSQMFVLMGRPEAEGRTDDPYGLWLTALHPDDRAAADAAAQANSRVIAPFGFEFRIQHPDGGVRWLLTRGNVLPNAAGAPGRMIGINIDITDRKRAEEALERRVAQRTQALRDTVAALQRSRERNAAIFANAPVDLAFLSVTADGRVRIEDVNPSWVRHAGYTREAVIGRSLEEALSPEHAALTMEHCRRVVELRAKVEYEYTAELPAGEATRRCFLVPLLDDDASVQNILLTAIDLTEMRRIEAQLRQAQKMEAIGQLTGGIAHDFNNLLTAILGNLEMLHATAPDDRAERRAAAAMRAARRGGELTQQLLAYARRQNLSPQAVDANAV